MFILSGIKLRNNVFPLETRSWVGRICVSFSVRLSVSQCHSAGLLSAEVTTSMETAIEWRRAKRSSVRREHAETGQMGKVLQGLDRWKMAQKDFPHLTLPCAGVSQVVKV